MAQTDPEKLSRGEELFHVGATFKEIGKEIGISYATARRYFGLDASRKLESIRCKQCAEVKSRNKFTVKSSKRLCIDCARSNYSAKSMEWLYGINMDVYVEMLRKQNGTCAMCPARTAGHNFKRLCVDHDHIDGKIRGLLCNRCNRVIGLAEENIELLESAISYLKQHNLGQRTPTEGPQRSSQ